MITSQTFTTGAYIQPKKLGNNKWVWIVVGFEDDTFDDTGKCIDPNVIAEFEDELVNEDEDQNG